MGWLLFGIALGFTIVTVITFHTQLSNQLSKTLPKNENLLPYGLFDDSLIPALHNISRLIPQSEPVVISDHGPVFEYFTRRHIEIPRGSYSEKSLFEYMNGSNFKYLVVYEGSSEVESLGPLFHSKGLYRLNSYFDEIVSYHTQYSKIHFYKIKS